MRAFSSAWVAPLFAHIASTSLAPALSLRRPSGLTSTLPDLAFRAFDLTFHLAFASRLMSKVPFLLQGFLTQDIPNLSQQENLPSQGHDVAARRPPFGEPHDLGRDCLHDPLVLFGVLVPVVDRGD